MNSEQVMWSAEEVIGFFNTKHQSIASSTSPVIKLAFENMVSGLLATKRRIESTEEHHCAYLKLIVEEETLNTLHWKDLALIDDVLFGFFYCGLSAIECSVYGVYSGCQSLRPNEFPLQEKQITIESTIKSFKNNAITKEFAESLEQLIALTDYKEWNDCRNVLTHRGIGRMKFEEATSNADYLWLAKLVLDENRTISLDKHTTESKISWLLIELIKLIKSGKNVLLNLEPEKASAKI